MCQICVVPLFVVQGPVTGVLELALPPNSIPDGWVDHQLMINEFHLTKANYGSRTLLMRVDKSVLV